MVKNIIIGVDGGCFEMINPLIEKDLLPNFKKLIENGFSSNLEVTIPPVTIPSWPCLFSGITPYQLGYNWFNHPKKGLINSHTWRDKSIFFLNEIKSFVLNVPGTFPAWDINGEMITGMLSPSISYYPKNLESLIGNDWIIDGSKISEIFKAFDIKKNLFLKKMKEDYNLMIYIIRMPDAISHLSKKGLKYTLRYINYSYIKIDAFLGEILEEKSFDNIFIFSDHGLKLYKKEFNVVRWLEKKGLLFLNESTKKLLKSIALKLFDIIRPFVNSISIKKKRLKIKNLFTGKVNLSQKKHFSTARLDSTSIQNYVSNIGGIFLHGKDKLKLNIIKKRLESDKHIKKVICPKLNYFPDLYIILKENLIFSDQPSLFLTRNRTTINHTLEGIFIVYGRDVIKGKQKVIKYFNVAPTILDFLNIEKRDHMIGNPLPIKKKGE